MLVSPPYSAVMEWGPVVSAAVEKVAVVPEIVPVPSVVAPSLKVTVPVGPVGDDAPDSVAVKVTEAPDAGVLLEAETAMVGVA